MPRIKPKGMKKMLKLHSLQELSKITEVPTEAFAKLEVPEGAFEPVVKRNRAPAPAYLRYHRIESKEKEVREYVQFVFTARLLHKHFKNVTDKTHFELTQGRAPHKDWFQLSVVPTGGNRYFGGGVRFSTKTIFDVKKYDKKKTYALETVIKDGVLYAKLPSELVPALR